jgi:transposase
VDLAGRRRGDDQSPFGGEATGSNPTDRAKRGVKRSLLVDGAGIPLAIVVDGANRHDSKLLEPTLTNVRRAGPDPRDVELKLCLDQGYDFPWVADLVEDYGCTAHIRSRFDEAQVPAFRCRRWVVERTHSWMNRFRRLLVRWEKKKANYLAMLHLTCAFITFRAAGVLG